MLMTVSLYEMKRFASDFLMSTYGLQLTVPLELNGRLKTTKGRFVWYTRSRKPKVVEMNKFFVQNNTDEVVLDVLKHELVHYALFMKGIPHQDGAPTFERELRRLGVVSQSTIDKYDIMHKVTKNVYRCNDCKKEHSLSRKLKYDGRYHKCKCGGGLSYLGRVQKVVAT